MNKIINDWINFCEDREKFDKSHFYTLFWEGITQNDLEYIFKYFPHSLELNSRTKEYLFGTKEKVTELVINEVLIDLAIKDLNQKISILIDNPELVELIGHLKVEFIQDSNYVIQLKNNSPFIDFFDAVNDNLSDNWILEDKKTFALYEAFYGLTKNYETVWYLFNPLFKIKINCEFYYKLSTLGGIYSFSDDKILVSKRF